VLRIGAVLSAQSLSLEVFMQKIRTLIAALAGAAVLTACGTWSDAQKGTAIGAGAGAAIGSAVGGGTLGTVGGAVVGGVVGHEVGERRDEKREQGQ
jgi:osmotically inducible lipoprotein OsmB